MAVLSDHNGGRVAAHSRPRRDAEEAAKLLPEIVVEADPVARLVRVVRPDGSLVGVEVTPNAEISSSSAMHRPRA